MINPEHEYWLDGNGKEWHVTEMSDSHLLNVYKLLQKRKEKNMQFVAVGDEVSRRGLV